MAKSLHDHVGSSYLSAKKLGERVLVGIVTGIKEELVRNPDGREETKHVLYIEGEPKGLVLNATNVDALTEIAGTDDPAEIVRKGIEVELRTEPCTFGGKKVEGIRVRLPS